MTQIDRYVLFLYSRVCVVCFLTLSGLLVVVQLFTNIDEFLTFGEVNGGLLQGLAKYFGPQMVSLYDRMCGLLTLLATMFVFAWLGRTNELTALLAAGISKGRIVRPILYASMIVIAFAAILRETVIPKFADILSKGPQELVGDTTEPLKPAEDHRYGILIVGQHMIPAKQLILNPAFKFSGPVSRTTRQITGDNAEYFSKSSDHPAGYLVRNFQASEKLHTMESIEIDGETLVFLPTDAAWLQPRECFIVSDLEFDMLSGGGTQQYISTAELVWRVKNQTHYFGADKQVLVHSRLLQPFLDFTQLLIGLPLILSMGNRNVVTMIASCILTYGVFFGISMGLRMLGDNGTLLTPAAAAWAPLILFGPIAWSRSVQAMNS